MITKSHIKLAANPTYEPRSAQGAFDNFHPRQIQLMVTKVGDDRTTITQLGKE